MDSLRKISEPAEAAEEEDKDYMPLALPRQRRRHSAAQAQQQELRVVDMSDPDELRAVLARGWRRVG